MNPTYPLFNLDVFSGFITLAIGLFSVLTLLYSLKYMRGKPGLVKYYIYIILTGLTSIGVVLANNLLLLLVFWGFLGLLLFLLINMGDRNSHAVAKKTFIIVG